MSQLMKTMHQMIRYTLLLIGFISFFAQTTHAEEYPGFKPVPWQFIAALADPNATSGTGAETWGLWRTDPGPNGVWLHLYEKLRAVGGYGPGNWKFDVDDWWVDENGLIMKAPDFPIPPGKYLVTGEREVTTVLTVHPKDENGQQAWELADNAQMHEVTHLPCRSSRFTPISGSGTCTPDNMSRDPFPLKIGTTVPAVEGCYKKDYQVMIVIALPEEA